jgi:alcohol dehydrogenase class IV
MATIHYITEVQLDFGAVRNLGAACRRLGIRRPLIVSDKGVVAAGLVAPVLDLLNDATSPGVCASVFDETPSNPTEAAVLKAVDTYRAHGADGLVAIGGGSSIDLAKGVAIMATHAGMLADYATILGGSARITVAVAPLIAVPTTAGTGSEVARGAIIILKDGRKLGFHSWHLVPRLAICDPELTIGLPVWLTAATGMDAMAHCIETYLGTSANPPADAIAYDGLKRAVAHIERATRDGADREARWNMMSASMQGAMAFQKGLGAVHSLSHALGGLKLGAQQQGPHHGTLNAVLLPEVIRFNEAVVPHKVAAVAEAFGLRGREANGEGVASAIRSLNHRLGLPDGLSAMGIEIESHCSVADHATRDHCHATNPRLATREDYLGLLERSS